MKKIIFWCGSKTGLIKYTTDKLSPETFITIIPDDTIGEASALFASTEMM